MDFLVVEARTSAGRADTVTRLFGSLMSFYIIVTVSAGSLFWGPLARFDPGALV
jgi:hypothetical protein